MSKTLILAPIKGQETPSNKLYWTLWGFYTKGPLSSFSRRWCQCCWTGGLHAKATGQGLLILWFLSLHSALKQCQLAQGLQVPRGAGRRAQLTLTHPPSSQNPDLYDELEIKTAQRITAWVRLEGTTVFCFGGFICLVFVFFVVFFVCGLFVWVWFWVGFFIFPFK